ADGKVLSPGSLFEYLDLIEEFKENKIQVGKYYRYRGSKYICVLDRFALNWNFRPAEMARYELAPVSDRDEVDMNIGERRSVDDTPEWVDEVEITIKVPKGSTYVVNGVTKTA
ncbi:MAG: hypothetical protein H7836_17400, partial [Magnetococcus sp. YQC-3]